MKTHGVAEPVDTFHQHLDVCERCRDQPFNLCATGLVELEASMKRLGAWLDDAVRPFTGTR